ncbi:MAG: hypothetical protein OHK0017_07540 [Patescibacteria group bacterium]
MSQRIQISSIPSEHDIIQEFLEQDSTFRQARAKAYVEYRNQYKILFPKPNLIQKIQMSVKENYLRWLRFTTYHATAAIILVVALVLGVTVSAAEVALPTDSTLKPSNIVKNIFDTNKQVERDPYSRLIPDTENYVTNLADCNLALKYPRQILGTRTGVYVKKNTVSGTTTGPKSIQSYYLQTAEQGKGLNTLSVSCYKANANQNEIFSMYLPGQKYWSVSKIDRDELRKITGWFVTEADLGEITARKFTSPYVTTYEILFTYQDKLYFMTFFDDADKASKQDQVSYSVGGVFGNQVQIQFNSLVNNDNKFDNEIIQEDQDQQKPQPEVKPDSNQNNNPPQPSSKWPSTDNSKLLGLDFSLVGDGCFSVLNKSNLKGKDCVLIGEKLSIKQTIRTCSIPEKDCATKLTLGRRYFNKQYIVGKAADTGTATVQVYEYNISDKKLAQPMQANLTSDLAAAELKECKTLESDLVYQNKKCWPNYTNEQVAQIKVENQKYFLLANNFEEYAPLKYPSYDTPYDEKLVLGYFDKKCVVPESKVVLEGDIKNTANQKNYLLFGLDVGNCNGAINRAWLLFEYDGKTYKLIDGAPDGLSSGGLFSLSPDQTKIAVTHGISSGIMCAASYSFKVIDLSDNRTLYDSSSIAKPEFEYNVQRLKYWLSEDQLDVENIALSEAECEANVNNDQFFQKKTERVLVKI